MSTTSTPYDDVFRTLLNDCSRLILPILNEVFGESYTGKEEIYFLPNEHIINQQGGEQEKRVTDACFVVVGQLGKKRYHIESQSEPDNSILVRIFEYDTQIALDSGKVVGNVLTVTFPHSALLYLRHNRNVPDKMTIRMVTPGGEVSYDVQVLKTQEYDLATIFNKKLYFLLPFHIFRYESRFADYEANEAQRQQLFDEFIKIQEKLEALNHQGTIDALTKQAIIDMTKKVVAHLAKKYQQVREGVDSIMGGRILEYEAKTIWQSGREDGQLSTLLHSVRSFVKKLGQPRFLCGTIRIQ